MGDDAEALLGGFKTRPATADDVDELTQIHIAGFTEEPQVLYCFPWRTQHPDEHWYWTHQEYDNYLQQPEKYSVRVLEAPSISENGETLVQPVGLAVWNLAVQTPAVGPDPLLADRKDADKPRCKAFAEVAGKRFDTYFAPWADNQVNLSALVVHPDFRRRGGGTMLVQWGIQKAEAQNWPTTLCASPMGRLLYEYLGFEKIAVEIVQVEGEKESLESTVMVRQS